jgi:SPP1 gp7 family putative phage head morphogenesis protein
MAKKQTAKQRDGYIAKIVPKAISRIRADIGTWKQALRTADNIDNPRRARLYNLYEDILADSHLTSKVEIRKKKALSTPMLIYLNGTPDDLLTENTNSSKWAMELNNHIFDIILYSHSLVELDFDEEGNPFVELIPRNNLMPEKGLLLLKEDDTAGIKYREVKEYGWFLLEFWDKKDYGLLNKAVPHVLFKRFAQACWSELCEIYAIPPRYIKCVQQLNQIMPERNLHANQQRGSRRRYQKRERIKRGSFPKTPRHHRRVRQANDKNPLEYNRHPRISENGRFSGRRNLRLPAGRRFGKTLENVRRNSAIFRPRPRLAERKIRSGYYRSKEPAAGTVRFFRIGARRALPLNKQLQSAFRQFHKNLSALYGCVRLQDKTMQNPPQFDHSKFDRAMQAIHAAAKVSPESLHLPAVHGLIDETYRVLSAAVDDGLAETAIPETMAASLDYDTFMFSGLKVYNEMKEGSLRLRNDDGSLKPFHKFLQEVKDIDRLYNEHYLEAEYEFATGSAQMAARWAQVEEDGDRYNLQYRTAGDDRVREEHRPLNRITLPPSDSFWNSYCPPNGWRCRCTIVQVLKDKYPQSDHSEAMQKGEAATTRLDKNGRNTLAIFRFNPGKRGQIFPPSHPYRSSNCTTCNRAQLKLAADIPCQEKCQACKVLQAAYKKSESAKLREKYLWEMKPLLKKKVTQEVNGKCIVIKFTQKGNKHLYSDTFGRAMGFDKTDLKNIEKDLKNAAFVKSATVSKTRKDSIKQFYYFKDKDRELYYNVAETVHKGGIFRFLYSVTDKIKK